MSKNNSDPYSHLLDALDEVAAFFQLTKVGVLRHALRQAIAKDELTQADLDALVEELQQTARSTVATAVQNALPEAYKQLKIPVRVQLTSDQLERAVDWMMARFDLVRAALTKVSVASALNTNASRNLSREDLRGLLQVLTPSQLQFLHAHAGRWPEIFARPAPKAQRRVNQPNKPFYQNK
jgi:hypothetical protein